MPKKSNPSVKSTASNGGVPAKKTKLSVEHLSATTSDDDDDEGGSRDKVDQASLNDLLLKKMEKAAENVPARETFKKFDFDNIIIKGHSSKDLRAQYDRLRVAAFRNVRHLPMKKEVSFVREYGKWKTPANAPKRPMSTYLRFMEDQRPKVVHKNPALANDYKELMKVCGEMWRGLSADKKQKYQDAYNNDMKEYYQEHPELAKKAKPASSKTRGPKPQKQVPPPKTAFDFFAESKNQEYTEKYELKGPELQQKLAAKFQKLSERKRQKWETLSRSAMEEYLQTLANIGSHNQSKADDMDDSHVSHDDPHDDPILAKSPVDKKEKKSKNNKKADSAYDNYLDSFSKGESSKPSKSGSPSKKAAQATRNSWLE